MRNRSAEKTSVPRLGPPGLGARECLFLIVVGAVSTAAMRFVHSLGWGYVPALLAGMAVAMGVQELMVRLVSPLLGPIDLRRPSMILAMLGPMVVCVVDVLGYVWSATRTVAAGAVLGLAAFALVRMHEAARGKIRHYGLPGE